MKYIKLDDLKELIRKRLDVYISAEKMGNSRCFEGEIIALKEVLKLLSKLPKKI